MKLFNVLYKNQKFLPSIRKIMRRTWFDWYLQRFKKDDKNEFNDDSIFMEVKTHVFKTAGYKKFPESSTSSLYKIAAYGTPVKYELEKMLPNLTRLSVTRSAYQIKGEVDLVHSIKENSKSESCETFIFRDGVVVFWNFSKEDTRNVMNLVSKYQTYGYELEQPMQSFDVHYYKVSKSRYCSIGADGVFTIPKKNNFHEKYTTSCMLATSVSLNIWQTVLENYLNKILESVAHDINLGYSVNVTARDVEQLHGRLSSLTFFMEINDQIYRPIAKGEQAKMDHFHKELWIQYSIPRRIKDLQKRLFHCNAICNLILVLHSHKQHTHSFILYYIASIATITFAMVTTLHKIHQSRKNRHLTRRRIFLWLEEMIRRRKN